MAAIWKDDDEGEHVDWKKIVWWVAQWWLWSIQLGLVVCVFGPLYMLSRFDVLKKSRRRAVLLEAIAAGKTPPRTLWQKTMTPWRLRPLEVRSMSAV